MHLVLAVYTTLGVNQAREGDVVAFKVGQGLLFGVLDQRDDLHARGPELPVMLRQLTKVPTAEGSLESPQKDQDHAGISAVVAKGQRRTIRPRQGKIRGRSPDRDKLGSDWHSLFHQNVYFAGFSRPAPQSPALLQ